MPIYDCTPSGGGSTTTGVSSFNGRTGSVVPQTGDYTAAQVGAADATTTKRALQTLSDEVDGILAGTSPVNIPPASEIKVGGIKVGEGLSATTDGTTSVAISQEANNATGILNGALYTSIPRPSAVYPLVEVTTVPATASVQVTATKGELSVQGTTDENGKVDIELSAFGVWTFAAAIEGEQATADVAVSASQLYSLTLSTVNVFGVAWDKTNPSTQLTRLTPTTDPNGLVTVAITTEPQPAVGTGAGSSPFDRYAPWSGMYVCNLSADGTETAKQGDGSFSYSTADVMVYIPEFYYRVIDTENIRYFYISDGQTGGFEVHPGSGKYVARYDTSAGYASVTGTAPLVNITRATVRTQSRAKGSGWDGYDYVTWCAVWLLYLVEFSDWNSQSVIGAGITGASAAQNNGGTDSMTYHTGRAEGADTLSAVQYRNIENPWGNVWQWIDGINFNNLVPYICTAPINYADDTTTDYTEAGATLPSSGWIMEIGLSLDSSWGFLPDSSGGSASSYISDYVYSGSGWKVLMIGGGWGSSSNAGIFCFHANYSSSDIGASFGSRILYRPQEVST